MPHAPVPMDADSILQCDVFDRDGRHLGRVDAVWRDPATGRAEFAAVHRGLTADRVVPVSTARWDAERRALVLAYPEETILHAPSVPMVDDLQDEDETRLREYYGLASLRSAPPIPQDRAFGSGGRAPEWSGASTGGSEEHIRLRQVLRLEREPQVRGEVERETVVEDDVIIPLDDRDLRA